MNLKANRLLGVLVLGVGALLGLLWLLDEGAPARAAPAAELRVCPGACAYTSVQAAVDDASDGDVIKVAAGSYTEINLRGGITQVVYVSKTVTLRGGYAPPNWDAHNRDANPTVLNAQGLSLIHI